MRSILLVVIITLSLVCQTVQKASRWVICTVLRLEMNCKTTSREKTSQVRYSPLVLKLWQTVNLLEKCMLFTGNFYATSSYGEKSFLDSLALACTVWFAQRFLSKPHSDNWWKSLARVFPTTKVYFFQQELLSEFAIPVSLCQSDCLCSRLRRSWVEP